MLKRENRLKKNKHFNYIYKNGQSAKNDALVLVYAKTKVKPFKVGFSVSNKIGKAVVRNKIKRQLREIVSAVSRKIDRRFNYVFVARESITSLNFTDINLCVLDVLKKANLLNVEG